MWGWTVGGSGGERECEGGVRAASGMCTVGNVGWLVGTAVLGVSVGEELGTFTIVG